MRKSLLTVGCAYGCGPTVMVVDPIIARPLDPLRAIEDCAVVDGVRLETVKRGDQWYTVEIKVTPCGPDYEVAARAFDNRLEQLEAGKDTPAVMDASEWDW